MKQIGIIFISILFSCVVAKSAEQAPPKVLTKVTPLPVELSDDFQFRKTKLFFLDERAITSTKRAEGGTVAKQGDATRKATSQRFARGQDASINFERDYRLFGAVTQLDQRQRVGNYFDFFWRSKRPANLTVRLEYRQEKLHALVQARELSYPNVKPGTHKSEFAIVGDDYFDDGRVIAWRCLLIEDGKIVAMRRSFMWE